MKAVLLLVTLGLGLCCPAFAQQPPDAPPSQPPNIIFIMADDLGYGDLGSYGQGQLQTPRLDRMAAEGMRFLQFYAGSTVCAPSRSVLMTGLHTGHTVVRGNRGVGLGEEPLPSEAVTVAELLREAGYRTGLVGKWGLGGPGSEGAPLQQGFDYFYGYLSQVRAHNYYPEYLWEQDEKIALANEVALTQHGYAKDLGGVATKRTEYSHDLLTEKALSFVERNNARPFFLYLAYTIPHANNQADDEGIEAPPYVGMEVPDYGPYADRDWPATEKGFAAMITRMDRDVGRLLDRLEELGLDENTLVIFTSDNGPHAEGGHNPDFFDSNGALRGIKRDLYEGGIRVPMIAWWPGRIEAGTESDHQGGFWDVMATACNMAGCAPPAGTDGLSFLPALLGEEQPAHDYLYWEFSAGGRKQAVRKGQWKAIRFLDEGDHVELYDLSANIGETDDLEASHPEIVREMRRIMQTAHTPSERFPLFPTE